MLQKFVLDQLACSDGLQDTCSQAGTVSLVLHCNTAAHNFMVPHVAHCHL
jgi:hypothetical protein